jgi:hypothetical protein
MRHGGVPICRYLPKRCPSDGWARSRYRLPQWHNESSVRRQLEEEHLFVDPRLKTARVMAGLEVVTGHYNTMKALCVVDWERCTYLSILSQKLID